MSEYVKKVLVFDELASGYRAGGKKVSGVLKIEKSGGKCSAGVYVTNFDRKKADGIVCALYVGGRYYTATSGDARFDVPINAVSQYDDAACLLAANEGDGLAPFAYAANCDKPTAQDLMGKLDGNINVAATQYDDFVCATDNYFDGARLNLDEIRRESEEKFSPVKKLSRVKAEDGMFFAEAKPILEKILKTYPPCDELNDTSSSFWVRVPFGKERFFAVGVVEKDGAPSYIAYGVPGRRGRKPDDDSFFFVPTKNREEGFWVLYQDISTGRCASPE